MGNPRDLVVCVLCGLALVSAAAPTTTITARPQTAQVRNSREGMKELALSYCLLQFTPARALLRRVREFVRHRGLCRFEFGCSR
jgi:hypothetical protein